MAIVGVGLGATACDLLIMFGGAVKLEMVYGPHGRLRVSIVAFDTKQQREAAEKVGQMMGWKARKAYSNKTSVKAGTRLEVHFKSQV